MFNSSLHAARRARLIAQLPPNAVAVIASAPIRMRTETAEHAYRQNNDFYYLTGFTEKNACLLLTTSPTAQTILFCEPKDPVKECWEGPRLGPENAPSVLGVSHAFSSGTIADELPALLSKKIVYANHAAKAAYGLSDAENAGVFIHAMRLIKSPEEVALMQKAADISVRAHQAGMSSIKPGLFEYQLAALYEFIFAKEGAQAPAYTSIVGGGKNACVLHYISNRDKFDKDALVLVDAAAEYDGYAADITRTYPVSGKFSGPQRALYDLVLAAQTKAITQMSPGSNFKRMDSAVIETLTQGLLDLNILSGSLEENIEKKTYKSYYMHSSGHWLGLDVHDVGEYRRSDVPTVFEPNMVMTIEPGLYMSPSAKLDEKWWNIGIRIEDDVCITPNGCDILSKNLVKTADDIEAFMREKPFEYAL